jgi:hypothetical protein
MGKIVGTNPRRRRATMPPTKPAAKQQAQHTVTGDGHPGDPAAKEQAQSSRPVPSIDEDTAAPQTAAPVMADPSAHSQIIDLNGCARCHANAHPGLLFEPLTYPVEDGGGEDPFTHWAACPTNGQPILLRQDEADAEPEPPAPADAGTA